jgi:hypothetical protein
VTVPDLLFPRFVARRNPKRVVRLTVFGKTGDDLVFGVADDQTETELENGVLNRACDAACCSCFRADTLSQVEATLVDPVTARAFAEFRYSEEHLTFKRNK